MFKKLKDAIESALDSLEGRSPDTTREDVERLLEGMREELIETKARVPVLEKDLQKLRMALEKETRLADDCHRRAVQAQEIGDEETVDVALRFEAKHRVAIDVWVQKIEAAEAELAMQRQTVAEQTEQLKEARARKDVLAIRARRAGSGERVRGGGRSSVDEFDRLVDEIEREDDLGAAGREVDLDLDGDYDDAELGPDDFGGGSSGLSREELAELQLEELKRRMKEDG
jgi:phage shock protein A